MTTIFHKLPLIARFDRFRVLMTLMISGMIFTVSPECRATIMVWNTQDGGNGHAYELVMPDTPQESLTWLQSRDAANLRSYLGVQGHLVTVGSAEEDSYLKTVFSSSLFEDQSIQVDRKYAWIGLYAPTTTASFQWVTGEEVNFTKWAPFEPNFPGEPYWQYVHYWTRDFGQGPTWTWNNEKNDGYNTPLNSYGYIVEYDLPKATAVPEPASIMSMGTLLLLTLFSRYSRARNRRKPGR